MFRHPPVALIVSYHAPPSNTSAASRIRRFSKYLASEGVAVKGLAKGDKDSSVRVWSGNPENTVYESSPMAASVGSRVYGRVLRRWSDRLSWYQPAKSALKRADVESVDVVISSSPPLVNHAIAFSMKRDFGVPWIADFRDPLVGNPENGDAIQNTISAVWQRQIFSSADHLIANTDAVLDLWERGYPQHRHKMSCIWNGFDPEEQVPQSAPPEAPPLELLHIGDLYLGRTPTRLLQSLERLRAAAHRCANQIRVSLIGPVEDMAGLLSIDVMRRALSSGQLVYNSTLVSRPDSLDLMSRAHGLVLLDLNKFNTCFQVPAKAYDYVRARRPILAFTAKGGPTARILATASDDHVCVYHDDPDDVVDRKVLGFLTAIKSEPTSVSDSFLASFSAPTLTHKLADIIRAIVGRNENVRNGLVVA
jgi:hypothetical protein